MPTSWKIVNVKKKRIVALLSFYFKRSRDFPGGAVVKNPHANAGDTGSSPGPGRFHMLRSD